MVPKLKYVQYTAYCIDTINIMDVSMCVMDENRHEIKLILFYAKTDLIQFIN